MQILLNPGVFTMLLAAIAVVYIYITSAVKGRKQPALPAPEEKKALDAPKADTPKIETATGDLVLTDTDEETAAVIMAIVSHESGIPLNRLSFKSIRLMEE